MEDFSQVVDNYSAKKIENDTHIVSNFALTNSLTHDFRKKTQAKSEHCSQKNSKRKPS